MKRILLPLVLLAAAVSLRAQSGLPTATPTQVTVPWSVTAPPTGEGVNIEKCVGTPASCTASSTNWSVVNASPLTSASGTFTDAAVASGTEYCYALEGVITVGSSTSQSGPSSIGCVTVPLAPVVPALGTLSASS